LILAILVKLSIDLRFSGLGGLSGRDGLILSTSSTKSTQSTSSTFFLTILLVFAKLSSMENLIPKHGGYRGLKTFQLSQLIFDITVRFCERFIDAKSRTKDQMVQAARSGVQNIAEGSQASGTSKKTELKLTNVARASLEELRLDYQDFLRQRQLTLWELSDPRRQQLINQRLTSADQFALWVKQQSQNQQGTIPEIAANGVLVFLSVACALLDRQITAQAEAFQRNGGFTERLYKVRKEARSQRE
jgi:four helix bundle suffix protein